MPSKPWLCSNDLLKPMQDVHVHHRLNHSPLRVGRAVAPGRLPAGVKRQFGTTTCLPTANCCCCAAAATLDCSSSLHKQAIQPGHELLTPQGSLLNSNACQNSNTAAPPWTTFIRQPTGASIRILMPMSYYQPSSSLVASPVELSRARQQHLHLVNTSLGCH
jgi:hypothetical protein